MKTVTIPKEEYDFLKNIRKDIEFIKENMISKDDILTDADKQAIDMAEVELEENKTISLKDLKSDLNL